MSDRATKRRRTDAGPPLAELPRPVFSAEDALSELMKGNVVTVVESHQEKLDLLGTVLRQSVVSQQSLMASGPNPHRMVLFVADDNPSISSYAAELEGMDFSVGQYTVAMHSAGVNQWPNVIYHDIIVVTANMLLDSLLDGSIKLSQAHLLVISDAQRVVPMVTPHPLLRVMDIHSKTQNAPQVLAISTNSPDRWATLDFLWLETSLRARTFFLRTKTVESWLGPMELAIEYEPHTPAQPEPPASAEIRKTDPQGLVIRPRDYDRAACVFLQLGAYAVNLYWGNIIDAVINGPAHTDSGRSDICAALSNVGARLADEKFDGVVGSPTYNATSKLEKLLQLVRACVHYGDAFRGIIFVKERAVARVLEQLLNNAHPFLRSVTVSSAEWRDSNRTRELLKSFDTGVYNLAILTKSSEDIDVAQANVIINFDLFDDQLSYAYAHVHSKGRHAHLVHLVERGNNQHRLLVTRFQSTDSDLRAWISGLVRGDAGLPPMTIHTSLDPYRSDDEDNDDTMFVREATTGARLYKSDAVAAVYRFAAEVYVAPCPEESQLSLRMNKIKEENGDVFYQYALSFPSMTRLPVITGPPCASQWEARRETCFQACRELVHVGLMNIRHFPQSRTSIAENPISLGQVKTAAASTNTRGYPRKTPDFWPNSQATGPGTILYPTVVVPQNLGEEAHAPVLLLTRAPLPPIPEFSVFYCGARAPVHSYKAEPLEVNEGQLRALHGYTLRATRSLTNKPFECPVGNLLCYFAPVDDSWHASLSPRWPLLSVKEHIPWDAVQLAADYFAIRLTDRSGSVDDRARDAIVLDRQVEFTMRHYVVKVRHDLSPLSKVEDSPREAGYPSFLEYCKARIKDFQGVEDENQPMLEVSAVPGVISNLHPTSAPPPAPQRAPLKYLIPELCHKFTIPASVFRTLWLIPSIMNKVDSYLLTKELNARLFHNTILEQQLLIALSAPSAWTEVNYDRLEFLGDAFLKVLASNFCFATLPTNDAGSMHVARGTIICNKTLQEGATEVGLPPYILAKRFVAKLWQPPTISVSVSASSPASGAEQSVDRDGDVQMTESDTLPTDDYTSQSKDKTDENDKGEGKDKGKGTDKGWRSKKQRQIDEQNTVWMGDKTVADVVEAILAASFLSRGHERALQTARVLRVPIPNVAQWADFSRLAAEHSTEMGTPAAAGTPPSQETVEAVERAVRASFARPDLLGQALTHTSTFAGSDGVSYDRLEFIGDAVLDFLVARYIWERHPSLSPGGLTLLKSAMVSNQTLAAFCVYIGLHQHLHIESSNLSASITKYVDYLDALRAKENDFAARENRLPGQYWLDMPIEAPKCLSDVVESIIGALYVGDHFFEAGVGQFFETVFKPFIQAHIRLQTLSTNPKATLLEFLQAEGCHSHSVDHLPRTNNNVPTQMRVVIHGKTIATAEDLSAAIATRKVALAALDILANEPDLLPRTCDCKSTVASAKNAKQKKRGERHDDSAADEEEEAAEVEAVMEALPEKGEDEDSA